VQVLFAAEAFALDVTTLVANVAIGTVYGWLLFHRAEQGLTQVLHAIFILSCFLAEMGNCFLKKEIQLPNTLPFISILSNWH